MSRPTPPHAADGGAPAADHRTPCPSHCPSDFTIHAPCRIIKVNGGSVRISARELWGYPIGTYSWTATDNPKIILSGATTPTVTVTSRADPSSGRDAETITVTRTATGCPPVEKTVSVTVVRVTFSESTNQRYGYDDFDTPNPNDDHVCVKSGGNTLLQVDIEGGATGSDFNFACDDSRIVTAPRASASFEMRLTADFPVAKLDTTLHARCTCPDATSFASIAVHVYREKRVRVVVAKIGTNLRLPSANYAAHQSAANDKLKQAVVMYRISNYNADNSILRVHYDLDGDRALSYDIANNGGSELDAIRRAMRGHGTKVRVAIVRELKSYYYLRDDITDSQTTITVTAPADRVFAYDPASRVMLGSSGNEEEVTVTNVAENPTFTITRATPPDNLAHSAGEPLEFPAGGWSSDPIIIQEGNIATLDTIKWTVIHEVGHVLSALNLRDVDHTNNIMHWTQDWTPDHRLRYRPRTKKHEDGTENQWETIPR